MLICVAKSTSNISPENVFALTTSNQEERTIFYSYSRVDCVSIQTLLFIPIQNSFTSAGVLRGAQ